MLTNMKKTLITLIVAAFAALTVSSFGQAAGPAGGPPPPGPGAAPGAAGHHGANVKKLEGALAQLNLTDQQKAQVKDLFGKVQVAHKELKAKVKSGQLSKDQAKAEIQKIGQETRTQLMAILTPAQKKQLAAIMKAERKNKGGAKNGTPPPPPPPSI